MELTSRKNETVRHLKKLGEDRKYRLERGEFLLEGTKLLTEAVKNGLIIRETVYCGERPAELPPSVFAYSAPRNIIEYISTQKTPQNVIFSASIPKMGGSPELSGTVILENIQDPGNLGTMLRTANAFGIKNIILTGDCADLYSPKTVRAGMGATFREKVFTMSLYELMALKTASGVKIYGAALSERSADLRKIDLSGAAVCIGNEGRGLSKELFSICDGEIIIPMSPECESLNAAAAAAVVMWEMTRKKEIL